MTNLPQTLPPPIPVIAPTDEKRLMKCPDCRNVVSRKAYSCPKCGRGINNPAMIVVKTLVWLSILGGIGAFIQHLP